MELDISEHEPKLKEILYRCLEEIQATKAALYLLDDSHDYLLATQYGFRDGLRDLVTPSDDVIDLLVTKRAAFFLNSLTEDNRFSELLYNADTTHMLVSPVYSRGKLVGFLDMRDKAAQKPFDKDDLREAQKISDQFLDLFAQKNLYGQRIPTLTNVRLPKLDSREPHQESKAIVDEARLAITRGVLRAQIQAQSLAEPQFSAGAAILPGVLGLSHVVIASFAEYSAVGGAIEIVAHGEITHEALDDYQMKLQSWLHRRGESASTARINVSYPYGKRGPQVTPPRIVSLLSAPIKVSGIGGLVLSAGFENQPDAETRSALENFLNEAQRAIEYSRGHEALLSANQKIAEKLLEPDMMKYPALAGHSRRVAELSERLARAIGLLPSQVETVRICGLVHDVGMRLLDYHELYQSQNLTADGLRLLREHPVVGAAIVADSPLGAEVAKAVYMHHERPDGTGYPEGVTGEKIPLASRIAHICESYDAMTSQESYQAPVDAQTALGKIRRGAGSQFDPDLSNRFCAMLGG